MTIVSPDTVVTTLFNAGHVMDIGSSSFRTLANSLTGMFPGTARTSSYTPTDITDRGTIIPMNVASANSFTIPTNASVLYDVGVMMGVLQIGAGQTSIVASAGVTLLPSTLSLTLRAQGSIIFVWQYSANVWYSWGDYT